MKWREKEWLMPGASVAVSNVPAVTPSLIATGRSPASPKANERGVLGDVQATTSEPVTLVTSLPLVTVPGHSPPKKMTEDVVPVKKRSSSRGTRRRSEVPAKEPTTGAKEPGAGGGVPEEGKGSA